MAKKISAIQRIVSFGLEASEDELNSAIESLLAIRQSRFPVVRKAARKPRGPNKPKDIPAGPKDYHKEEEQVQ